LHWRSITQDNSRPSTTSPVAPRAPIFSTNNNNSECFVNNSLFENQGSGCLFLAGLAAALFGGQPLVSLLGNGQTDSLASGHGHPWLVALETKGAKIRLISNDRRAHV